MSDVTNRYNVNLNEPYSVVDTKNEQYSYYF